MGKENPGLSNGRMNTEQGEQEILNNEVGSDSLILFIIQYSLFICSKFSLPPFCHLQAQPPPFPGVPRYK